MIVCFTLRFNHPLIIVTVFFIFVGIGEKLETTQKAIPQNTIVIGSTIFPNTVEVKHCVDRMSKYTNVHNSGAWVSKCLKEQATTTTGMHLRTECALDYCRCQVN